MILADLVYRIKPFCAKLALSRTTQHYLTCLFLTFAFHCGRMTASQAASALLAQPRHRANLARQLAQLGWKSHILAQLWQHSEMLQAALKVDAKARLTAVTTRRWLFILDQTSCSQQGPTSTNTYSTGNRQRRPKKGRRHGTKKYVPKTVHSFVCGLLITPTGERLPCVKPYFTKTYGQRLGRKHRTQAELGAELIKELPVPDGTHVVVLGDTAYEAQVIQAACADRSFTYVVPVNPERVLDVPVRRGQKRPKVRSRIKRLQVSQMIPLRLSPHTGAYVAQRRRSASRSGASQAVRTYYVHTETCAVARVGHVRLAFSSKIKPRRGRKVEVQKILMTNDVELSAADMVELYELRWQIELFFKELKSHLGMHQYRFKDFRKVAAWVEVALATFLWLEWQRWRRLRSSTLSAKRRDWWQRQRTSGIVKALRIEGRRAEWAEVQRLVKTKTGLKKLRRQLREALPLEQRVAC